MSDHPFDDVDRLGWGNHILDLHDSEPWRDMGRGQSLILTDQISRVYTPLRDRLPQDMSLNDVEIQ